MLIAVLDADVLFPMLLRDTLLRAGAADCFRLHWSSRILDEVIRNLVSDYGMDPERAALLRTVMEEAFPEAMVKGWKALEPQMRNHPKDRHVAAAAAVAGAGIIVTSNIRDFADLPDGIAAMTPDDFLCALLEAKEDGLLDALTAQAAAYRRPETTLSELIEKLAGIAPTFSARAMTVLNQKSY
ncbi:PIN domain-containing protein [Rhizobium sp. 768_B6_N1_8]|uniref:PIN domain-containing protein n=1 Tax=unclassified Rhizobium TaxID=2613769 RepID=UPI003F257369